MSADSPYQVTHAPDRSRFETEVEGAVAFLEYELGDGEVAMTHTIVPRHLEGRGIAAELTRTAVAWAREQELHVVPVCSYVRAWLRRNPEAA
jgi:predicted GNAT family acetyltransferase